MSACPHTSLHGIQLENSAGLDRRRLRLNEIGPDLWECDGCLTIQVEDSIEIILGANGKDIRAQLAEAKRLLADYHQALHACVVSDCTVELCRARAFLELDIEARAHYGAARAGGE